MRCERVREHELGPDEDTSLRKPPSPKSAPSSRGSPASRSEEKLSRPRQERRERVLCSKRAGLLIELRGTAVSRGRAEGSGTPETVGELGKALGARPLLRCSLPRSFPAHCKLGPPLGRTLPSSVLAAWLAVHPWPPQQVCLIAPREASRSSLLVAQLNCPPYLAVFPWLAQ